MVTVREYFGNITNAVRTTYKGMKITLKYWVKEPSITVEYPDRIGGLRSEDLVSERFRGYLKVETSKCTGCLLCMRVCPIDCILIEVNRRDDRRYLDRFDIDQAKCMYCGLCVEECPSAAILFSKKYEGACYDMKELCVSHVSSPVPAARPAKKEAPE
ncbi:MAG: 4Fe-4S binding protein [Nitrospirae bacterium]|nr:4Fe-4S binding protein [Nitrospirota bacterium]